MYDRDGVIFSKCSIAGKSEKEKDERRGGKEPQKGRRRPRTKKQKAGKKEGQYTCVKRGRGGSHYKKWAPDLTFWSKKHMCPSAFLRGSLRAIVSDLSSHNAMEHKRGSTQRMGKLRRLRNREGRVGDI